MIRQYEKYKDSGVEWIGEIPDGWEVKKLKYVKAESKNSFVDGPFGSHLKTEHFVNDGDVYVIDSGFITSGRFLHHKEFKTITKEHFETINRSECVENDIIIAKIGANFGMSGILPKLNKPSVVSGNSLKLTIGKGYNLKCLHYQLLNLKQIGIIDIEVKGSAQPALSMQLISEMPLLKPTSEEQTTISSFLDRKTAEIDQLISRKEKLIALYEEEKTTIINQAVTKGIDPKVKTKPSGIEWLGDIPEHWEVKKLKFITSLLNDGTHGTFKRTTSGYRLLSVRNIINDEFVFREDDSRVSEEDFISITKQFIVTGGDIQLAIVGATLGKVAMVPKLDENFATQRSVATIRTRQELINNKYFFFFLKSLSFQSFLWLNAGFSAQPGIYLGSLENCHIPMPNLLEQLAIVAHIETECSRLDTIIDKFKKQIDLLKEYRTTLISEVVTGKIDVRDEVTA